MLKSYLKGLIWSGSGLGGDVYGVLISWKIGPGLLIHHVEVCRGKLVEIELMSFEYWLVLQVEKACLVGRM